MEHRYKKYIYEYDKPGTYAWGIDFLPFKLITQVDNNVLTGANYYLMHWVMPHEEPFIEVGHPPHIHKDAELLFHIGTNPDDPMDLGSEVEFYLGKEMERHVINRTCMVFIPPNFIHCPWRPLKTTRPFIFLQVHQGAFHTEKGFHHLLPPELVSSVNSNFVDQGY